MPNVKLSALPVAAALRGQERLAALQDGANVTIGAEQLLEYVRGAALPAPYLGPVASRGGIPNATSTANRSAQDTTVHRATQTVEATKLVFMNGYVDGTYGANSFAEIAPAGTVERQASIEPVLGGARHAYRFGGATTGTAAVGVLVETDWLEHPPIRAGQPFRTRNRHTGSNQCFVIGGTAGGGGLRTLGGEGIELGATTTDKTLSGTMASPSGAIGGSVYRAPPVAVLGMTRRGTVCLFGNSRGRGVTDIGDAQGAAGAIERSLHGIAVLNASVAGDRLNRWLQSSTLRRQIARYCSHVIGMDCINDVSVGERTAAQFLADAGGFAALFPGQNVLLPTAQPYTTSSDGWASVANQTVTGAEQRRLEVNAGLRGFGVAGMRDVLDLALPVEDAGRWKPGMTGDGLHEVLAGALAVAAQRTVHPAMFAR